MAAKSAEPVQKLNAAYGAILFVGGLSLIVGLIAVLFEVKFLRQLGHGYASIVSGIVFLILGSFVKRGSMIALGIAVAFYAIDAVVSISMMIKQPGSVPPVGGILFRVFLLIPMIRGFGAIQEMTRVSPVPPPKVPHQTASGATPRQIPPMQSGSPASISFVAPNVESTPKLRPADAGPGAIRFVAYRCEIGNAAFHAIYPNSNQRELTWTEIGAIVVRLFPLGPPLDGKLFLDVIPISASIVRPIRLLSDTYVNYSVLPQGQSASSRENIRRLAEFIMSQNAAVYVDPGTGAFLKSGATPVRFTSMSQFHEYDSRYG